jgi:hypothetical protein
MRYYTPPPIESVAGLTNFFIHFIDHKGFPFYRVVAAISEGDAIVQAILEDSTEYLTDRPSFVKAERFPEFDVAFVAKTETPVASRFLHADPLDEPLSRMYEGRIGDGATSKSNEYREHMARVARWLAEEKLPLEAYSWGAIATILNRQANINIARTPSGLKWKQENLSTAFFAALGWNKKTLQSAITAFHARRNQKILASARTSVDDSTSILMVFLPTSTQDFRRCSASITRN